MDRWSILQPLLTFGHISFPYIHLLGLFLKLRYNLHTTVFAVLVAFSIFTGLYNHHHYLIPKFSAPPKETPTHWQSLPIPPPTRLWQPPNCFLSLCSCPFWTFQINGIKQCMAFCVWLLSLKI